MNRTMYLLAIITGFFCRSAFTGLLGINVGVSQVPTSGSPGSLRADRQYRLAAVVDASPFALAMNVTPVTG